MIKNEKIKITIRGPKLAYYQIQILESKARFTVTEASTKAGKTFSHIWWLFAKAHGLYGEVKEGWNYWWVAPVYKQAEIAFNRMRRKVAKNPAYKINLSNLTIVTPLGTVIEFRSAEKPDNLYGDDVHAAVFDEFTRAREEAWYALRSTLTATKGQCKLIGNVKGKKNWGYRLALKAKSKEDNYEYFKITAYDAVAAGILDLEEIEQAKKDLPEAVFKELYLAEPSEDGSNPFGGQFIRACIRPMSQDKAVCYGVDLAKYTDYTVELGLDGNGSTAHFERYRRDWKQTEESINRLPDLPTAIDSTGVGDPIVENVQRKRRKTEGFKFSSQSKQQLMEGLAVAIQSGLIGFPEGIITDELEAFEFVHTRTGVRYSAPDGVHDDTVCALALAYSKWTAAAHKKKVKVRPINLNQR